MRLRETVHCDPSTPRPAGLVLTSGPPLTKEKTIWIVRHGLSTWNAEGRIQGDTDASALTERGREQAARCRDALAAIPFDSCFTSPLARAREFAEIVWEGRGAPLVHVDDLREAELGLLQGLLNRDAEALYPELYRLWRSRPQDLEIGGARPVEAVFERALRAWQTVLEAPGSCHLVVAHKSLFRALLCTAVGLGPGGFRSLDCANGGVSVVAVNRRGEPMVTGLNLTAHLTQEGVRYDPER